MPKTADESKKISSKTRKKVKTYNSMLVASEKYDKEKVDNIRVRFPKGWKEKVEAYVSSSNKYSSVNNMICSLVKQEVGIDDN